VRRAVRLNGDAMNPTLVKALVASVPVLLLLVYSVAVLVGHHTLSAVLQLVGAACLVVTVLTHIAEALHLLPAMRWGEPDSMGHYVDLSSAVLGVTLTAIAYTLRRRERRSDQGRSSA
jgi:hypothetical protein